MQTNLVELWECSYVTVWVLKSTWLTLHSEESFEQLWHPTLSPHWTDYGWFTDGENLRLFYSFPITKQMAVNIAPEVLTRLTQGQRGSSHALLAMANTKNVKMEATNNIQHASTCIFNMWWSSLLWKEDIISHARNSFIIALSACFKRRYCDGTFFILLDILKNDNFPSMNSWTKLMESTAQILNSTIWKSHNNIIRVYLVYTGKW